jgi:serine/threonine protein kinase
VARLLGQGGMGQVYAATEPVTGATVALKLLQPGLCGDPRIAHAFLREAQHMYTLSHPAILKVMEVSDSSESPYFVMPYMAQGSLADRISRSGALAAGDALAIAEPVAQAIAFAHGKGLIHRDLKPANILLSEDGHPYVTDFGLVRSYMGDSMLRPDQQTVEGTPAYMSPRVAEGHAEDTRCDVYAFGATLYEMLTGRPPYTGTTASAVLDAVVTGPPEPVLSVNARASRPLAAVCGWCMARELRDRYASMADVVEDLSRIRSGKSPRGPHGTARSPRIALVTVAAAFVVIVAVALLWRPLFGPGRQDVVPPHRAPSAPPPGAHATPTTAEISRLWEQAQQAQRDGAIKLATETYRRIIDAKPDHVQAREAFARQLMQLGHLGAAENELKRWLDYDPDNATARALLKEVQDRQTSGTSRHEPPTPPEGRGPRGPARPGEGLLRRLPPAHDMPGPMPD